MLLRDRRLDRRRRRLDRRRWRRDWRRDWRDPPRLGMRRRARFLLVQYDLRLPAFVILQCLRFPQAGRLWPLQPVVLPRVFPIIQYIYIIILTAAYVHAPFFRVILASVFLLCIINC